MVKKKQLTQDTFEEWLARQKVVSSSRKIGKKIVPDSYEEWINKRVEKLLKKGKRDKGT